VGYKFSLVLSREISESESVLLKEVGCQQAVFGADTLPTDATVPVTKLEFDDTLSPTLAEAIESALQAVQTIPGLGVPGLTVPAQPAKHDGDAQSQGEALIGEPLTEAVEA